MLHRMLIPSSSFSYSSSSLLFNPSSLHPLPLRPPHTAPIPPSAYSHLLQVGKEIDMEALKASLRPGSLFSGEQQPQEQECISEEVDWVVEKGNLFGEGFSVDDLLNLGEFTENEKEAEEEVGGEFETEAEVRHMETERSNSYSSSPTSSSALTFELPPPPPLSDILRAHDAEELEWVSFIIDDSIPEYPPPCSSVAPPLNDDKHENRQPSAAAPQGHGPSSLSPTICALSTEAQVSAKAKRSKRSRSVTAAWSKAGSFPFADSSSASSASSADTSTTTSASSCTYTSASSPFLIRDTPAIAADESFLLYSLPPPPPKKQKPNKRGRKPKAPKPSAAPSAASGERRCSHCGVQKTPQWRAGPLGAKTLCNACGVRFKSGRLHPEYRPACSPTFVSHMHSNSHRKVLEMRRKNEGELLTAVAPPIAS